jgi:hypothetical protein
VSLIPVSEHTCESGIGAECSLHEHESPARPRTKHKDARE